MRLCYVKRRYKNINVIHTTTTSKTTIMIYINE